MSKSYSKTPEISNFPSFVFASRTSITPKCVISCHSRGSWFSLPKAPLFTGCVLALLWPWPSVSAHVCCLPGLWASRGRSTCTLCFARFQATATEQNEGMPWPCCLSFCTQGPHGATRWQPSTHASFLSLHLWCERVQISHPWQKLFFRKVCRRHSVFCQSKVSSELKSPESSTGIGCEQPGQVPAQLLLGSGSTEKLLDSPGPSPGRETAVLFVGSEHGAWGWKGSSLPLPGWAVGTWWMMDGPRQELLLRLNWHPACQGQDGLHSLLGPGMPKRGGCQHERAACEQGAGVLGRNLIHSHLGGAW